MDVTIALCVGLVVGFVIGALFGGASIQAHFQKKLAEECKEKLVLAADNAELGQSLVLVSNRLECATMEIEHLRAETERFRKDKLKAWGVPDKI